jgi:hypothetical protein
MYINIKVKLSLCLTKHHTINTYWGSGGRASHILDLSTRWRWVASFKLRLLYPWERAPDIHWIGGWVGTRAVLETVVKRKIPSPRRESNPRTPTVQPVAQRYTDCTYTYKRIQICESKLGSLYTHTHTHTHTHTRHAEWLILKIHFNCFNTYHGIVPVSII